MQFIVMLIWRIRPVGQLGGFVYGRAVSTFERPRSKCDIKVPESELLTKLEAEKLNSE